MSILDITRLKAYLDWGKIGNGVKNLGRWVVLDLCLPFAIREGCAWIIRFTARGIHQIGLKVLGNREAYRTNEKNQKTGWDYLRLRAWKVVTKVENLEERIDKKISQVFGIRPSAEVEALRQQFAYNAPYTLEIIRMVFIRQVKDSVAQVASQHAGTLIAEALGYTFVGRQYFVLLYAIEFITDLARGYKDFEEGAEGLDFLRRRVKDLSDAVKELSDINQKAKTSQALNQEDLQIIEGEIQYLQAKVVHNPLSRSTKLEQEVQQCHARFSEWQKKNTPQ